MVFLIYNLKANITKILGIHFSYNGNLKTDQNYKDRYIIKIEKIIEIVEYGTANN